MQKHIETAAVDALAAAAYDRSFWQSATGPLAIPMTNDYLFRALMQRNNKVLKGLICSLLHLSPKDITTVIITNPIELGQSIDRKTFMLDIKVFLNESVFINLEMQVINRHNWPERSLSYLCRNFDNLHSGEDFLSVRPVIQIGLLDFTLFENHPEFYATYQFLNVKNYTLYSDKLRLSVLDLTRIDLASKEDKHYHIDYWASLFKAATWEEIKMLAQKNEFISEASATIYQLSQEEKVRLQCEAREDFYRQQKDMESVMKKLYSKNQSLSSMNLELSTQNQKLVSEHKKLLTWAKEHGYETGSNTD